MYVPCENKVKFFNMRRQILSGPDLFGFRSLDSLSRSILEKKAFLVNETPYVKKNKTETKFKLFRRCLKIDFSNVFILRSL